MLTLGKERAQIDQVVRVEVSGAAGHAFDEVTQVSRIGPGLHLEVREEYAEAIALAQLPVVRRRMRQSAARDGVLALCGRSSRHHACRLQGEYHSHRKNRRELARKEVQIVDTFRKHTHLEHKAGKQDRYEGEVAKQAEFIVSVVLKWLGDRREEKDYK
eukprot:scaffold22164_cov68-Phaeocystis_antarctica.AAC.4